jgi:hypothetical protein
MQTYSDGDIENERESRHEDAAEAFDCANARGDEDCNCETHLEPEPGTEFRGWGDPRIGELSERARFFEAQQGAGPVERECADRGMPCELHGVDDGIRSWPTFTIEGDGTVIQHRPL